MPGIDVVDLGDPEAAPGARHPRFDLRVFSADERAAIAASAEPELARWGLWAAKEAAFKLLARRAPGLRFAPLRFRVALAGARARVRHAGEEVAVELRRCGDALHALAGDAGAAGLLCAVAERPPGLDPSRAARELAARLVAEDLALPASALAFGRRGRAPTLRVRGLARELALSLAHHGRFVACACDVGSAA
jgi:phosphopantetheinyl transferase (holo-ACP synthase)